MSDHGLFSSYEGLQGAANGQETRGAFSGMRMALDGWHAGSRADFTSSTRPPPPWTRYFNFPFFCTICGLEKLGLVDQNRLEPNLSALLLRTLAVTNM